MSSTRVGWAGLPQSLAGNVVAAAARLAVACCFDTVGETLTRASIRIPYLDCGGRPFP